MSWKSAVSLLLLIVIGTGFATQAWAALPGSTTPDGIEGACNEKGGTYFPPNENGTYACILPDGTWWVCTKGGCTEYSALVSGTGFGGLPGGTTLPWAVGGMMLQTQILNKLNKIDQEVQSLGVIQ